MERGYLKIEKKNSKLKKYIHKMKIKKKKKKWIVGKRKEKKASKFCLE